MTTAPVPSHRPAGAGSTADVPAARRRVVDAPTRMFHWLFAASFLVAYLSGDSERWRLLHVTAGYVMVGLLAFRVLYGMVGPPQVRLGPLYRRLAALPSWVRSVAHEARQGRFEVVGGRQGQNLLMTIAVVALLVLTVPLTLSGHGSSAGWGDALGGDWLEDVHEFFGETFLAVVLAHIGLIVLRSLLTRRNLALPMMTGFAPGAGPDLVRCNRAWLAGLLLIAIVVFAGWYAWQAPGAAPSDAGRVPETPVALALRSPRFAADGGCPENPDLPPVGRG